MFEKVSQAAERVATRASRRQFLGRLGRGAMAAAAAAAGLLALPTVSRGAKKPYICPAGSWWRCVGQPEGTTCEYRSVCKRIKNSTLCTCWSKDG